jgi:hypothetical protein
VLTPTKLSFINSTIIPAVKEHFELSLSLDNVAGNLLFTGLSDCSCGSSTGVNVPTSYQTIGVPADIVLFVTARTTRFTSNTIAFACPCAADNSTQRPVAGYINWGPNAISLQFDDYREQLGVAIHESTHALGFTSGQYKFYGDPSGNASPQVKKVYFENGLNHSVQMLVTPKLLQVARSYFNCSTLDGVELENGGSSGTAASHWERRLFQNEYMTGYSSYDPVFSIFKIALLEDTGWYYPNYSMAAPFTFGKNMGCSFVQNRCKDRSAPYKCDSDIAEACSWDKLKKSRCNIATYSDALDPWYQEFSDPTLGSIDELADYCTLFSYDSKYRGDCTVSQYNLPGDIYFETDAYGEVYCPNCRCLTALTTSSNMEGPTCHNISCSSDGTMHIKIGYIWYPCNQGDSISITTGFDGNYKCPDKDICMDIPVDNDEWPSYVQVIPDNANLGDYITVTATKFGSNPQVLLGPYYGCNDVTINGNDLKCQIGIRTDAPRLRGNQLVDVVVVDQDTGHTAFGEKAFTINPANVLSSNTFQCFLFVLFVLFV